VILASEPSRAAAATRGAGRRSAGAL